MVIIIYFLIIIGISGLVLFSFSTISRLAEKRENLFLLSQLNAYEILFLRMVALAYSKGDVSRVNKMVERMDDTVRQKIVSLLSPANRSNLTSSGSAGVEIWVKFAVKLTEQGYSFESALLIPCLVSRDLVKFFTKKSYNSK